MNHPAPELGESLTLAWADRDERRQVLALASQAGRQTMNLRTMPGAELFVLRRSTSGFAGWAGVDVTFDPRHPEVFSQFVYPQFRSAGIGSLLEHVWWSYLDSKSCATAFRRKELETNATLFKHRLASGYCRQVSTQELGTRFAWACRSCELFGHSCRRQVFLAVSVRKAPAASIATRGPLDLGAPPMRLREWTPASRASAPGASSAAAMP